MSKPAAVILLDLRQGGVSGASIAANDREMASDFSRREASGDRTMPPLQTNGQANRGGAAIVLSCDDWWEQLQSHNRHLSNGKLS